MNGLLIACGLLFALLAVWLAIEMWRPLDRHVRQAPEPRGVIMDERADMTVMVDEYVFDLFSDGHIEVTVPSGVKMYLSSRAAMGLTWHLARQYGWINTGSEDGRGAPCRGKMPDDS
jgi:hypothetical protein